MTSESIFTQLGEVVENHDSRRIPLSSMQRLERSGPYPYYGATEIMDFVDDFIFEGLHILLAEDGSVLNEDGSPVLQLVDGKFWVNNHAHVLRGSDDIDTCFLYYALSIAYAAPWVTGAVQLKINQKSMNKIEIHYPPRGERKIIVSRLKLIDDYIENQKQKSSNIQKLISALFRSWFIDFDPVKVKSEGKLPHGMDEETAALFPNSFKDSELGSIPTGWKVGTLLDIARFQNGYAFKNEDWCDEGIPVIKIGSVKPGFVDLNSCSYVHEDCVEGLQKFQLNGGDIVVGMTGYVGETGLVLNSNVKPYLNQRVGKIFPLEKRYYEFIYLNLRNTSFKSHAQNFATGSAQANVSSSNLMAYTIVIPPRKIMECFSSLTNPMIQQILHSFSMINFASNIRDSMLPKLMSGELEVPMEA